MNDDDIDTSTWKQTGQDILGEVMADHGLFCSLMIPEPSWMLFLMAVLMGIY